MNIASAQDPDSRAKKLHITYLTATGVTLAAIIVFAGIGSWALPASLGLSRMSALGHQTIITALLLNVALILFGWRRSKDLKSALTAQDQAERSAYRSAFTDHVTGLPNRRQLFEHLENSLADPASRGALLLLDLDHFKKVNDQHGHATGDALLHMVGSRLGEAVPNGSFCARLGGDEFAILMKGDFLPEETSSATRRILRILSEPMQLGNVTVHLSASIGLTGLAVPGGGDAETVLRRSDIAMYEAKRLGRNRWVWFDAEMERQLHSRARLESEMRSGIEDGQFLPFFQPLVSLATGDLKGFEVLARWNHPTRGIVEPDEFIGIAESTGMISGLSFQVMRQAFKQAREWPAELTIAVNISPVQFKDPRLSHHLLKLLLETGFPAQRLEVEITESSLLDDQDQALATVESLKNCGIRISLDDFGTGYASLTQLRSLPFDRIKIDRSFVASLLVDPQSSAIVSTIAGLGSSLGLPITAEGVETAEVRRQLESLGCSDAQGWLFGKAITAAAVREMLSLKDAPPPASWGPGSDGPASQVDPASAERRDFLRRPAKRKIA